MVGVRLAKRWNQLLINGYLVCWGGYESAKLGVRWYECVKDCTDLCQSSY